MTNVGRTIYGYCEGFFDRDSYDAKRIEAEGPGWIVARALYEDSRPEFASFTGNWAGYKQNAIDKWAVKEAE